MIRREKQVRKYRGSRVHGFGRVGQHRKSGMRGGKGGAGKHKHLYSGLSKAEKEAMGSYGFTRCPKLVQTSRFINVGELEDLIETLPKDLEDTKMANHAIELDITKFGYEKILGRGNVSRKMIIKAYSFSKKAIDKIEAVGGKADYIAEE